MKNVQKNKIKMYDTVQTVCLQHEVAWQSNAPFKDAYMAFADKLEALKALSAEHMTSSKGVTALKSLVLEKTIKHAMILGNVIGAYALKVGDTELLMRNIYTKSEWQRGSSILKINRFKNLLEDFTAHEAELIAYGVEATAVQDFEIAFKQFEALAKQPRLSIVNRKQKTQEIADRFAEIDLILSGQLDRIINVFSITDSKFSAKYANARFIVDQKGKRSKFPDKDVPRERDDGSNLDDEPKAPDGL